ncbi:MAG: regulation of enolase protein 1 (concanavalin A-like superfamily) [Glaciecola sp.]
MQALTLSLICLGAAAYLVEPIQAQAVVRLNPISQASARQSVSSVAQALPQVAFEANPAAVVEGDAAFALNLKLSVPSNWPAEVTLVSTGSAQLGVDFTLDTQTVVFAPGQVMAQVQVTALSDMDSEGIESIDLSLNQPRFAHLGTGASHRVFLSDASGSGSNVGGILTSDDFDRCGDLAPLWSTVDPLGDGSAEILGIGSGQAVMKMQAAAGVEHQAWNALSCPQVLQPLASGDFEAEVAFTDSPANDEIYGVLVKQDANNWIRFDFYRHSGTLYAFVGRTINGRTHQKLNTSIAGAGSGLWMRVNRTANNYSLRVSIDGVLWTTLTTFGYGFAPTEIGPYLGSFGSNPAADMDVDYMFDAESPIFPEDSGFKSNPVLALDVSGSGSTTMDPVGPAFACGTDVTLTATPDSGWSFDSWTGDVASTDASIVVTMDGPYDITAVFVSTSNPPLISNIQVVPSYNDAVVTWDTDQPASSLVNFGTSAGYGSQMTSAALVTNHQLQLSGLSEQTLYHFQVVSENAGAETTQSADASFTTTLAPIPTLISDDFNVCADLGPAWTFQDGASLEGSYGLQGGGSNDAQLWISVPAGSDHQAYDSIDCPRVTQSVSDTDFGVEVKFDSEITDAYQLQGLLVEQDADNWLRFDVFSTAAGPYFYAGSTVGGSTVQEGIGELSASAPYYLRVARSSNQWTFEHSPDGTTWTTLASFNHALTVNTVGPYAGNGAASGGNPAPAFTALCDYVFDVITPITPEDDGPADDGPFTLTAGVSGSGGSVQRSPDSPTYTCGDQVTLTALPDSGFQFTGWSGHASGTTNPLIVSINQDTGILAQFTLVSLDPIISNVVVVPSHSDALITWDTDQQTDSLVYFGSTASYGSQVQDGALVTSHQLLLTGLSAQTQYHFQVVSANSSGAIDQSADAVFTTEVEPISVLLSDDFNGCGGLGPAWTFYDSPAFDSSFALQGTGTNDAQLSISVPAGSEHRAWNSLGVPRVMQSIDDTNFEMEVKFDSEMPSAYQYQGILVQEDEINWLTFHLYGTGSGARYYAGSTDAGGTHFKADGPLIGSAPYYLRVARSGNQWTFDHSQDGTAWTTLKSFSRAMAVNQVGPYAGNSDLMGGATSPAFTALCDYVFDTSDPISPEDGAAGGGGPFVLTTSVPGVGGTVQASPVAASYNCGDQVTLTAVPDSGYQFSGWGADASGITNPLLVSINGATDITAQFTFDNGTPIIANVVVVPGANSAVVTWDTIEPADGSVAYGLTAGLGNTEGHANQSTSHMVVLPSLDPVTLYHYQITSTDANGGATVHPLATFTTESAGSLVSDDFHEANLDRAVWTFDDPHGVAGLALTGSGTADAYLEMEVPAGVVYEPWLVNGAAKLSQPVVDEDFAFQAKFENPIVEINTTTGVFAEMDVDDWIRLDYYFDGTDLNVLSARFVGGQPANMQTAQVQAGPWSDDSPLYLRISRQGNFWVTEYGFDGLSWLPVGSFTSTLVPNKVGIMCGNAIESANPHTIRVDWCESVLLPIQNEDLAAGADVTAPYVYDVDAVPLSENALQISWATEEPSTGSVEWGTSAAYGMAPANSGGLALRHTVTLLGLTADTTYHFRVVSDDSVPNSGATVDQTVQTHKLPGIGEPEIQFWYGTVDTLTGAQLLSFGALGNCQNQFNVLGRLLDADQDRVALEVDLVYRLNSGAWRTLAVGDDRLFNFDPWRLANEGDFNLELFVEQLAGAPLVGGVHRSTLEFRATDDIGNETLTTALVDYTPAVTWVDSLTVSWANVANNLAGRLEEAVQVVDGKWEVFDDPILGHVLRPDPNELGYDRLISIGEGHGPDGWDNYEVLLPVTVHSFDPQGYTTGTGSYGMGFVMRWTGHTANGPYAQPNHGLYPLGGLYIYRWFNNSERWELWIDENEDILPQPGNAISLGVTNWYRIRCEDAPGGGTTYSLKVWEDGSTEPTAWTFEHTTNPGDPKKGSLVLVAHHVNASFGDVVVTHLP